MTTTQHGYLHSIYGEDMDGSSRSFEWIEDVPQEGDENEAGWFAMCEVQPEAGWLGPFKTEAEAIYAATTEDGMMKAIYGDDPMGDHMGRNN